ncbi:MAG: restriction endonuclease subunit S [Chloroflexi bacterium]|nr:restriction endonuclease subunit S [Chloroflexota bacterium]
MTNLPSKWELKTLAECCEVVGQYGANSPSIDYSEELPRYIRITDITDEGRLLQDGKVSVILQGNEKYILSSGDFLFARSGATVGKSYLYHEQDGWAIYAGYLIKFRTNENILISEYLKHFTQSEMYWTWVKNSLRAGAQPNINAKEYSNILIPLPPLAEQRQIAAILSTWDEAITLTEQLIDALQRRKQALMQLLLTGAVRFPEFDGEWIAQRFGDIFERVTRRNDSLNTNVLTISAQHGLVSQQEFFNKIVAGEGIENYYLLKQGEFAYNRSYSNGYPYGAMKRLDDYDEGILSTLYICFRLIEGMGNSDFFTHFFESGALNRGIYTIAQEGARNHGLLNLAIGDFFDLIVNVPSLEEQNKMAEFFEVQERVLNIVIEQKKELEKQKRGLMQQLLTGAVRVQVEE